MNELHNGEKWLLDIKTSNSLHASQDLQLAAYAQAWNETFEEKIEKTGIIWLKSSKRGEGKGDKMQGKGWEIYEPTRTFEENLNKSVNKSKMQKSNYNNNNNIHTSEDIRGIKKSKRSRKGERAYKSSSFRGRCRMPKPCCLQCVRHKASTLSFYVLHRVEVD